MQLIGRFGVKLSVTATTMTRQEQFDLILDQYNSLIYKVCFMYARDKDHLKDLYQESLANIWQGLPSFRGDSQISTWIYRTTINSCITFFRRYSNYDVNRRSLELAGDAEADSYDKTSQLNTMYRMISELSDMNKAIILMWLDDCSYDQIAEVTGLSRNNVASRIRRIKLSLAQQANS